MYATVCGWHHLEKAMEVITDQAENNVRYDYLLNVAVGGGN